MNDKMINNVNTSKSNGRLLLGATSGIFNSIITNFAKTRQTKAAVTSGSYEPKKGEFVDTITEHYYIF